MRLWALSDLHLRSTLNVAGFASIEPHPGDWLILAGDVGETERHLEKALELATERFAQVLWVPGNHELWTSLKEETSQRGEAKYERLVELCRSFGVLTPEDPYPTWPEDPGLTLVPMFLLYDYTFGPDDVAPEDAVRWAMEKSVLCTDEVLLHPHPHASRADWCRARCALTEARLEALPEGQRTVLINHFPLRRDHAVLPAIPRFAIWCGTRATEDWHLRFNAEVVVYGHLHLRTTRTLDGVRFEEVSLGHPKQWSLDRGAASYLRQILPGEAVPPGVTVTRR